MAALTFPTSPSVGQSYTASTGVTYTWDGTKWNVNTAGNGVGLSGTWHDVTSSRAVDTTYTNTNNYPIAVSAFSNAAGVQWFNFYVNGIKVYSWGSSYDGGSPYGAAGGWCIVPAGSTYKLDFSGFASLSKWFELY